MVWMRIRKWYQKWQNDLYGTGIKYFLLFKKYDRCSEFIDENGDSCNISEKLNCDSCNITEKLNCAMLITVKTFIENDEVDVQRL